MTSPVSPSRSAGARTSGPARPGDRGRRRARGHHPGGRARRRSWHPAQSSRRVDGHQPRSARCTPSVPISWPAMASPSPVDTLATRSASVKWAVASTMARASATGCALEDARAHEHRLGPQLHHQRGVGRRGDPAGTEQRHRQATGGGDLLDQADRGGELLGPAVPLGRIGLGDPADVSEDGAQVADGLHDVAGPRLALGTDQAAPSETRRSASPRLVAPHTNGTW